MIFHQYKAIFFHSGKTAGVSIEKMLDPGPREVGKPDWQRFFGADPDSRINLQHASAEFMQARVSPDIFKRYFKFSVVRNPYTRLCSVFHYQYDHHCHLYGDFAGFIRALPELWQTPAVLGGSHYLHQTAYTHIDGEPVCDEVLRFESLQSGVEKIRGILGVERPFQHLNRRPDQAYKAAPVASHYSPASVDIMLQLYADDFGEFGYSTDPEQARF